MPAKAKHVKKRKGVVLITVSATTLNRIFQQLQEEAHLEGMIQGRREAARECEGRINCQKDAAYNAACEECAIFNAAAAERLQIKKQKEHPNDKH